VRSNARSAGCRDRLSYCKAAEGAFNPRQIVVGLDGFLGVEMLSRYAGADHIDAIEARFYRDLLSPSPEREMRIADLDGEVLGHLPAVRHPSARRAALGGAVQGTVLAAQLRLNTRKHSFSGRQQFLALARAFRRKFAIATNNEPLAGEPLGRADLGQFLLIARGGAGFCKTLSDFGLTA
jgi:hypothetical protein